jgi:nicotinamidase-related amidase
MSIPRRALIVVDVQNEYFDGVLEIQHPPRDRSLANIVRALRVAEDHNLPVVLVRHELPEDAPVFAVGSTGWAIHPEVEALQRPSWKQISKHDSSAFAGTDLASWLAEQGVDTVTIVGYMTNNCDLATAASAEEHGYAAEVLSDATGAIHLANEAGKVTAEQLHDVLMVLLQSNFAAVATTDAWAAAVGSGQPLPKNDLGTSAMQGRAAFAG